MREVVDTLAQMNASDCVPIIQQFEDAQERPNRGIKFMVRN